VPVGSEAVNRIISAQTLVARAEAGSMPWSELISLVDTNKNLGHVEDPYEFVGDLYFNFRIVEAAAYANRDKHDNLTRVLRELVTWAQMQHLAIERQVEINASYTPANGLERLGQQSIEEKCRWALHLLEDSFPAWGY
jgi:hypothetical protein